MSLPPPSAEAVERFRADLGATIGGLPQRLGVAVSGGADSLALLLLAHAALPGRVRAATVDHRLRPEAAGEAAFVAAICAGLGIGHDILRPAEAIAGNLQSAARRARYALLRAWRQEHSVDWVATAHHVDDQAETVLMRLNRGAGVAGLAGVRAVNGKVVRPLLSWRRSELGAIVAAAGLEAVADPSNCDQRYDRARLRKHLAGADWIDPPAWARSAAALADAEESLQWASDRCWAERADRAGSAIRLDPGGLPAELRRRLIRRVLDELTGGSVARGAELSRFIASLESGASATLAGVKGEGGAIWRFERAPPRRS